MAFLPVGIPADIDMDTGAAEPDISTVEDWAEQTDYSDTCCDDVFEYRRVTVPRAMMSVVPRDRCMDESEWRSFGICMSRGWRHYDLHSPESNVLLFRRVRGTCPKTGQIPAEAQARMQERLAYIALVEQERQRIIDEKARQMEMMDECF